MSARRTSTSGCGASSNKLTLRPPGKMLLKNTTIICTFIIRTFDYTDLYNYVAQWTDALSPTMGRGASCGFSCREHRHSTKAVRACQE